jgi:hypothetical protein
MDHTDVKSRRFGLHENLQKMEEGMSSQTQQEDVMSAIVIVGGVEYAPVKPAGGRAVVVVDRGWIFAGDVTRENGRIRISRAVHVMRWEGSGFAGLIDDPKKAQATIKPIADVDMPEIGEIFCVPVADEWGL